MRRDKSARPARLRYVWVTLAMAILGTLLLAACGGGTTPAAAPATTSQPAATTAPTTAATGAVMKVQIVEKGNNVYAFDPPTLTITKGTQVIWTNMSDAPHTVTSDAGAFDTPSSLMQNQTFSTTFNTSGTFTYHCAIHTYMKASITVTG
ncbi:MAG TPA: plastocyanin/azurin family copper-binding protein [Ktedonosporobacter sp.]|nr:plastocyanin/azurin family copper-binding protein [Ktedonosporobacter sp.]